MKIGNNGRRGSEVYNSLRKGKRHDWQGDRSQTTLWDNIQHIKSETGHSTQKPIECMKRPIENNTEPGESVYEPFCGSGTTIIACEMTGRTALAIELDPAFVQVAIERWQTFTGKLAKLDGRTLEQIMKDQGNGRNKGNRDGAKSPSVRAARKGARVRASRVATASNT